MFVSLPRLELCGAFLLVGQTEAVKQAMSLNFNVMQASTNFSLMAYWLPSSLEEVCC